MLMNDTPVSVGLPVGVPFEPIKESHIVTLRYRDRVLIDDVAGEELPADMSMANAICVSDLPSSTKVVRPGMLWPQGLLLPRDTLVMVVDNQS
ncbi:hypothetical protein GGI07_002524, partial [Coemansia sp. Benny D115]